MEDNTKLLINSKIKQKTKSTLTLTDIADFDDNLIDLEMIITDIHSALVINSSINMMDLVVEYLKYGTTKNIIDKLYATETVEPNVIIIAEAIYNDTISVLLKKKRKMN